ncbi:hypothetical protein QJQ45_001744 [Haematococcus lacustris]|nr:hypothetical protein QJQ45_001744 [Haematococcus lacustris]
MGCFFEARRRGEAARSPCPSNRPQPPYLAPRDSNGEARSRCPCHQFCVHGASPRLASPRLASPRLASPRLASPRLASPRLASPRLASPRLASPRLASPRLASPRLASPRLIGIAPPEARTDDACASCSGQQDQEQGQDQVPPNPPPPAQAPPAHAQAQPLPAAPGPAPRPQGPPWGRWLDRDTNGCLNLQRIGESLQHPLELCSWKDLEALPPIGEECQQGYKRVNDRLPKVRQRLHRAAEYRRGINERARNTA